MPFLFCFVLCGFAYSWFARFLDLRAALNRPAPHFSTSHRLVPRSALGYADEVPLMAKYLWRKGYLRMPTSCTTDEHGTGDSSTCRSSCPAEVHFFFFYPWLNPR